MVRFKGFWKRLGNLGKQKFFKKEDKVSLALYSASYSTLIDTMAKFFDNDYERAFDVSIDLITPMSGGYVSKLIYETSVLGIKINTILSKFKDLKDFKYIIDILLYSMYGSSTKRMFDKTVYISASESAEKVNTYFIIIKACPFCHIATVPAEKLGAHRYGKFIVFTIEQMVQIILDFFKRNFQVVGREVRCFHRGDEVGEIRLWLYPRDNLTLMEENKYLQKIK
ncbi:MAG: hypothetical protein ACFFD2_20165 [Promethearchaeota archaeon]